MNLLISVGTPVHRGSVHSETTYRNLKNPWWITSKRIDFKSFAKSCKNNSGRLWRPDGNCQEIFSRKSVLHL